MLGSKTITVDDAITDITPMVDDEEMRQRSKGWYTKQVRDALTELGFDTLFDERNFVAAIPTSLVIDLPEGFAGMKNMWVFNGPVCAPGCRENVYIKKNMIRHGAGNYYANNREGMRDALMERSMPQENNNFYYAGEQNGKLMLSSSCASFESIYVVYGGLGSDIGKAPIIPEYLKTAVVDYVVYNAVRFLHAKDPNRWAQSLNVADKALNGGGRPQLGSWHKAMVRVAQIDPKEVADLRLTLSSFGYPGR
jgi:hypothetical protein